MTYEEFNEIRASLPEQPGIYKYFDKDANLIYVGKAKNIRKRVSSYFTNRRFESARTKLLVLRIAKIEFTVVHTEQDALLLENSLIKENQPKYNVQLKDDKTYPYVCIKKEPFPRVFLTRNFIRDGSEYFGPYTSVGRVRLILETITKTFPLRTCNLALNKKNIDACKFKVCLEYHIGNCLGPCQAHQSEESYNESIQLIRNILKGNISIVIDDLKQRMQECAEAFEFEEANILKEKTVYLSNYQSKSTIVNPKLSDLDVFGLAEREGYVFVNYFRVSNGTIISTRSFEVKKKLDESKEELLPLVIEEITLERESPIEELVVPFPIEWENEKVKITVPLSGDKKKLLDLSQKNAELALKEKLTQVIKARTETPSKRILTQLMIDLRMKEVPEHIECFDNSNIQGTHPVAACVVFKNAKPSKKDYRHFNIKTVEGPNDFASMEEVVSRRYKRLLEDASPLPQLIIIDGGKGQLSAAMQAILNLGLKGKMTVIGIAKKLEEIYFPEDQYPLYIDKKSESLRLIQQLRNEAHRFGITFHRNQRSKGAIKSQLDGIPGLGEKSIKLLWNHFKTISAIRDADDASIIALIGEARCKALREHLSIADQ